MNIEPATATHRTTEILVQKLPKLSKGLIQYMPVCPTAQVFTRILGRNTITEREIEDIKRLGFKARLQGPEGKYL